ncbi:Uncharacterised protein [Raoultella terrigena]|uniref:Making large colonies protein n=1 Tax=Raoultella terrigena TaxID=577 RepID=A0A3P8IZW8_RAOTE|nr:Uncharacterised protein [Raoultella terrigena]
MSKPAIGALVKELLAAGVLQESAMAASSGQGRPSVTLSLSPDAACAIGISLIDHQLVVVLMNGIGEKMAERHLTPEVEIPALIQQLAAEIADLLSSAAVNRQRLAGIGFASPPSLTPPSRFACSLRCWAGIRFRWRIC